MHDYAQEPRNNRRHFIHHIHLQKIAETARI